MVQYEISRLQRKEAPTIYLETLKQLWNYLQSKWNKW